MTNLEYTPQDVVVKMLRDSAIYEDDNLLVIDKPYGLPSHGGPGVHHSVGGLLDQLATLMKLKNSLHLIHR